MAALFGEREAEPRDTYVISLIAAERDTFRDGNICVFLLSIIPFFAAASLVGEHVAWGVCAAACDDSESARPIEYALQHLPHHGGLEGDPGEDQV